MSDIVSSELRICRTCHEPQPTSEYYVNSKYQCKSCYRRAARERGQRNSSGALFKQGKLLDVPETLRCNTCGEVKPTSEFKKNRHHAIGYQRRCKYCYNQDSRRNGRRDTLARYNLTLEQYDRMLERQDGKCAICKRLPKSSKCLVVDHDHQTGEVRALLCSHCNTTLGFVEGPNLEKFLTYIRYHSGKAS